MSVDGLVSGINTSDMIAQLMNLERQPQVRLGVKRDAATADANIYKTLNTRFAAIKDAAAALTKATGFDATKATSSATGVVTASSTPTAAAGSLTFTVDRLATAHSLVSVGTVAATSAVIAPAGSNMLLAAGGALGLGTLAGSADLAEGTHTIEVTRATTGASQAGAALATDTTIAAGATLDVVVDGVARSITLTAGTYGRSALADMVTNAAGGDLKATVGSDGGLVLTTTREGSAASLAVSAGTAVGFAAPTATAVGTDGTITVDGVATTVSDTSATMTLASTVGSVTATFSGGLRAGSVTAQNVDLGDGTLGAVTAAINGAGAGMTAAAVQVGPGAFRLQISSKATGEAGRLSIDPAALSGMALETLSAGADAKLTVGTGSSAFSVTSSTNTVTDALPGVTLSLKTTSTDPVTVGISTDVAALADRVGAMISAVNSAAFNISSQASYDPATKKAGALLGDATARMLANELRQAVGGTAGLKAVGIEFNKDGTVKFDKEAFTTAYNADPAAVTATFQSDALAVDGKKAGLAHRLEAMGKNATDSINGTITTAIKGRENAASQLSRQMEEWDVRLASREKALRRQFGGLEVALGKLRDQSTWLAGQLAGLSNNNG